MLYRRLARGHRCPVVEPQHGGAAVHGTMGKDCPEKPASDVVRNAVSRVQKRQWRAGRSYAANRAAEPPHRENFAASTARADESQLRALLK